MEVLSGGSTEGISSSSELGVGVANDICITTNINSNSNNSDQDSGLDMDLDNDSPTPPVIIQELTAPLQPLHLSSDSDKKAANPDIVSPFATEAVPGPHNAIQEIDPYANEPDESLAERLWGLTEMFPECVRNAADATVTNTWSGIKSLYSLSRNVSWIIASSSVILFAPVLFEVERVKVQEMQKNQQKQFLLGPSAAIGGGGGVPAPPLPR